MGEKRRNGWAYYAAVVLFVAIFAFALLGLVRTTSLSGGQPERSATPVARSDGPRARSIALRTGPVPTAQIPRPTPSGPTRPPSRTYLHPPPELAASPIPEPAAQPRL